MLDLICDFMRASQQALAETTDPKQRQRIQHHIEALEWLKEVAERDISNKLGGGVIITVLGGYHVPLVSMN